jgi:molybdopterin converting factor small subunit
MITVKLFGLLRLDSGIKEIRLEAASVKEVHRMLLEQTERISRKDLDGCVILVNGSRASKRTKLKDGDEVILLSPVAGG